MFTQIVIEVRCR